MTKKEKRKFIYDKYNGHCYLCGCELKGRFHVDELLPVKRKWKLLKAGYYHKIIKQMKPIEHRAMNDHGYEFKDSRLVADGMEYPERLHIDNQMPACPSCNINKHSMSLEDFRKLIQGFVVSLNRDSVQYKVAKRYGLITETKKPILFYCETIALLKHLKKIK